MSTPSPLAYLCEWNEEVSHVPNLGVVKPPAGVAAAQPTPAAPSVVDRIAADLRRAGDVAATLRRPVTPKPPTKPVQR